MAKGYVIARASVTNAGKGQYAAKTKDALDKYEGRPIIRGGKCELIEGTGTPRNSCWNFLSYRARARLCEVGRVCSRQRAARRRRHDRHHRR